MKTLLKYYKSEPLKISRYIGASLIFVFLILSLFFPKILASSTFIHICFGLILALSIPSAVLTIILCIEKILENKYSRLILHIIMAILTLISGAIALSVARRLIHSAMGIDPSFFPSSLTIVSVLFLIPSWIYVLSCTLLITAFGFLISIEVFKISSVKISLSEIIGTGIGIIGIIVIGGKISSYIMDNTHFADKSPNFYMTLRSVVASLDFYDGKECANINRGKLFCYIGENRVAVYHDGNLTITNCN